MFYRYKWWLINISPFILEGQSGRRSHEPVDQLRGGYGPKQTPVSWKKSRLRKKS